MPAAAVIPAPIVHIKVAAIKKHVAGFWGACIDPTQLCGVLNAGVLSSGLGSVMALARADYHEEIGVLKACVLQLNSTAWDNFT